MYDDEYGPRAARYYDAAYEARGFLGPDADFYAGLARECAGPVLELGCGTGRALLPIAREGLPCVGLDASPHMLDALRAKRPPADLELVQAPMQAFDLGERRFALIFSAFRAFQHLIEVEEQLACLACVRRHLAPGGAFAFDVFNPRLDRTAIVEEGEQEDARFRDEGDEIVRLTRVRRDHAHQKMWVEMRYERRRAADCVGDDRVGFWMRWFFRYELEHLLRRAGFTDLTLYGDFDRGAFEAGSPAMLWVAR